jgi:hypothetical protein
VVELSAVPGKDEEIIDILEAEAEEAAAAKAALGAKVAPSSPRTRPEPGLPSPRGPRCGLWAVACSISFAPRQGG